MKSRKVKLVYHPTLDYVGLTNEFMHKGKKKFAVDLFDLTSGDALPHQ